MLTKPGSIIGQKNSVPDKATIDKRRQREELLKHSSGFTTTLAQVSVLAESIMEYPGEQWQCPGILDEGDDPWATWSSSEIPKNLGVLRHEQEAMPRRTSAHSFDRVWYSRAHNRPPQSGDITMWSLLLPCRQWSSDGDTEWGLLYTVLLPWPQHCTVQTIGSHPCSLFCNTSVFKGWPPFSYKR